MNILIPVDSNGYTFNDVVLKPMLRMAEDTDDTFYPYVMTNAELMSALNALSPKVPVQYTYEFVTSDYTTQETFYKITYDRFVTIIGNYIDISKPFNVFLSSEAYGQGVSVMFPFGLVSSASSFWYPPARYISFASVPDDFQWISSSQGPIPDSFGILKTYRAYGENGAKPQYMYIFGYPK